jgi:uncharacterized GH25 family protein
MRALHATPGIAKRFRRQTLIVGLAVTLWLMLGTIAGLSAHDMWIEPTSFSVDLGRVLGVKLRVGDNFHGDPIPRTESMIDRFVVVDANGTREVVGREGADPAGLLRVTAMGLMVVGYQSKPNPVTLPGPKFTSYLKEQALDAVLAARLARGQTDAEGREVFTRCAKALVAGSAGPVGSGMGDRALGFTLELVAEAAPASLKPGQDFPVKLLFQGRPMAGARIVAVNQRSPFDRVTGTTDTGGRARLRLPMAGTWLVKAVHMVPAPPASNADWSSYWASLTFEVGSDS